MHRFLIAAFVLAAACCLRSPAGAAPAALYVAPGGSDGWSGTLPAANKAKTDGPFATLERARDEIRKWRAAGPLPKEGVTVYVRGGTYELARPLELTAEDSGTPEAPITYRNYPKEGVRLVGGRVVTGWKPVSDPAALARLDEAARGKVLQADLKALGLADLGEMKPDPDWTQSAPGLEVFFRDEPMTLARWPNEGSARIADLVVQDGHSIHGIKGSKEGVFTYEGDRPKRWAGEKDVMLHGYWFWDWADQRCRVESIDTEKRVITLHNPNHAFGFRKGQWYYAYNLLCELDRPGEWHLDRDAGILHFWPPAPVGSGKTIVSVLPSLVTLKDASHVVLRGFHLEGARGTAVTVSGGTGCQVVGCVIRNVGGWAVSASGEGHRIAGCDITQVAQGGISLSGGDRNRLTPGGLVAENNHIHHFSRWKPVYRAAISLQGVGNRAAHNLIHDAPHMAIGFGGNEHVIELNEIHSVVHHSNDAGVMYCGYDWSARGHEIRYNYIHHIYGHEGKGCVGVYLDDQFSSAHIHGNLFYKVPSAAFIGGGRDSTIENNVFVDCNPAVHVDARGLGWASGARTRLTERLKSAPYQEEPWKTRYPQLLTLLDDPDAMAPEGNLIARNIQWGGRWDGIEGKARPLLTFQDNLLNEDPRFVHAEKLDFRLRDDSPAFKLGFKPIPIEKMGLYASEERASWPVKHQVRPAPARPAAAAPAGPAPVCKASRLAKAPTIDGALSPGEWGKPESALVIEQGIQGERAKPQSRAWVAHDGTHLLVVMENAVDPAQPLKMGDAWGSNDAVEVALRNAAAKDAPILVLRGFAGGAWSASDEAGAPPPAVTKAAEGVQYAAKVAGPGMWVAEWRIPFASLGIDPAKGGRFAFNLSVRKTAGDLWLMWRGTRSYTWDVGAAGTLEVVP